MPLVEEECKLVVQLVFVFVLISREVGSVVAEAVEHRSTTLQHSIRIS